MSRTCLNMCNKQSAGRTQRIGQYLWGRRILLMVWLRMSWLETMKKLVLRQGSDSKMSKIYFSSQMLHDTLFLQQIVCCSVFQHRNLLCVPQYVLTFTIFGWHFFHMLSFSFCYSIALTTRVACKYCITDHPIYNIFNDNKITLRVLKKKAGF